MAADAAMLAHVPLFKLMDDEERATLAEHLNAIRLPKGEVVFSYGDVGDALYIIQRGRVRISVEDTAGQAITLAELGPGELFGEISLLDGGPRTAGATVTEDATLLVLDREDLLEFITRRPPSALGLLAVMGQRLRATDERLRGHPAGAGRPAAGPTPRDRSPVDPLAGLLGSWPFLVLAVAGLVGGWYWAESGPSTERAVGLLRLLSAAAAMLLIQTFLILRYLIKTIY